MPGVYGYIKKNKDENQIHKMSSSLLYQENFLQDDTFANNFLECSHIHIGNMKKDTKYLFKDGIYISIEGEQYDFNDKSFEEFLFEAYINNILEKKLNALDGYFHAIIYDTNINKIFLFSDRYGMRMLYYYYKDNNFAFCGEVKGLLNLDFVDKKISQRSFDCFIDLGYLVEDNTWFENIKLIKPATIMEFDIDKKELSQKYYWKWSEIQQQNISFEEATEKLGHIFIEAVNKRFDSRKRVGIALSGGLDSRAILAAVDYLHPDFQCATYTFGVKGCDDIEIAKLVAQKINCKHKIFYFTEDNWFTPRIEKISNTDGMMDMMHMHGSEFLEELSSDTDFNLNGYAGDVVCGGGWFPKLPLNKRANKEHLQIFYGKYINLCNYNDNFYDINNCEPHLYMNRVRRFTNMGSVNGLSSIDQRKPFFDNKLIELIYSLPDEYRKDNKLYSAMLLKFFPNFFKDIPWQKTRKNLDGRESSLISKQNIIRGYMNYAGAIREEKILKEFYEILDYNKSVYKNFTDIDVVKNYLHPHIDSMQVNHIDKILKYVTIELYLREIYETTDN